MEVSEPPNLHLQKQLSHLISCERCRVLLGNNFYPSVRSFKRNLFTRWLNTFKHRWINQITWVLILSPKSIAGRVFETTGLKAEVGKVTVPLICTEVFLWLTHENLINLKISSATLGIGGAIVPIAPPSGYTPDCGRFKMQLTKQQGILHFFNKDWFQVSGKNNSQSGHELSTSYTTICKKNTYRYLDSSRMN